MKVEGFISFPSLGLKGSCLRTNLQRILRSKGSFLTSRILAKVFEAAEKGLRGGSSHHIRCPRHHVWSRFYMSMVDSSQMLVSCCAIFSHSLNPCRSSEPLWKPLGESTSEFLYVLLISRSFERQDVAVFTDEEA